MKKIIVIGVTGSGKSTLASKLAVKLNFPYIQLDQLFWKPNWTQTPDKEFLEKIKKAIKRENWVLDGNYGRTNHITWREADTIIWIDLPFWQTFYQNISRSFGRAIKGKEIWEGTGNKESIIRMFSKDSIVRWLFKTYKPHRAKYESRMNSTEYSHLTFYRLKSRKEIADFLE